jgi:outer membrane protein assembly factor BamD (BamD/ComL family)
MNTPRLIRIREMVMIGVERDGMLSLKGIIVLLLYALFCQPLAAQDPADLANPSRLYADSTNALYNLDFSTAQRGYEALTRSYPDNPDYWNALASSQWLKITYDQQKLNIESFSGKASFGTKESKEGVSPEEEKRLRDTVATAMAKAQAILDKNPNDIRALYAMGIANATLASFESTVKRSYLTAHSKAKAARNFHQQVLKLDPNFDDARLSVGTYDYVIGVIPSFFRLLLAPLGIRSAGKDAGILELETAASKGRIASTDARMVLAVVYVREKKYDEALKLISDLHGRYPRNFLFELAKGSIYGKMMKGDDAVRVYEDVLAKVHAKKDGYERLREGRVYTLLGNANIDRMQFEKAGEEFAHVVASRDATMDEKGSAYLWMGKIYDSKKDRASAVKQYDLLLKLDCDPNLKAEAQKFKRRPYGS